MEEFLYYCRVASKDVKISCENAMCIMNHFVLGNYGVSKYNLHVIWETIIFGFVIMSPNVPNLGYCSSYYKYIITGGQVMSIKSKSKVSVLVRCTCVCFHLEYFNEILGGQHSKLESTFDSRWFWFRIVGVNSQMINILTPFLALSSTYIHSKAHNMLSTMLDPHSKNIKVI